jgi:hypothetical protein
MRLRLSFLVVSTFALACPAWAQWLTGRLYPEKQEYLVGEPVVVVLDVANKGSRTVSVDDSNDCGFVPAFEVPNAEPVTRTGLWGCSGAGYGGSCLGALIELRPGQHFERRYLLKGPFLLLYPGLY